jgi:hypothetical protein
MMKGHWYRRRSLVCGLWPCNSQKKDGKQNNHQREIGSMSLPDWVEISAILGDCINYRMD